MKTTKNIAKSRTTVDEPYKIGDVTYMLITADEQLATPIKTHLSLVANSGFHSFIDLLFESAFIYGYKAGTEKHPNGEIKVWGFAARRSILELFDTLRILCRVIDKYDWDTAAVIKEDVWEIYNLLDDDLYRCNATVVENIKQLVLLHTHYRYTAEGWDPIEYLSHNTRVLEVFQNVENLFAEVRRLFKEQDAANSPIRLNAMPDASEYPSLSSLQPGTYAIIKKGGQQLILDMIEFDKQTKELVGVVGESDYLIERVHAKDVQEIYKACQVSEQQRA